MILGSIMAKLSFKGRVRALASAAQDFLRRHRPPYADIEILELTGNVISSACTLL